MAPASDKVDHNVLEAQLKDIIQDLYELMVQTSSYDTSGPGVRSRDVLQGTIDHLHSSLLALHNSTSSAAAPSINVPPELIQYVDGGRNPDIYTREFVELARRGNQLMRGKMNAFADMRDVLAKEMLGAMPELREDVETVVASTGGDVQKMVREVEREANREGDNGVVET